MVKTKPKIYRKCVTIKNRRTVLYVKLQKSLYGCLRSALLFYEKLVADLNSIGLIINPYDPCVAYMMVNGNHTNITWHVNDLKILHVDAYGVKKVID